MPTPIAKEGTNQHTLVSEVLKLLELRGPMPAADLFKAVEDGNVTAMIWWDKTRNQVREKIGLEAPMPPVGLPGADPEKASMLEVARRVAFVLTMGAEATPTATPPAAPKPKAKQRQPA